jgi:hypothetical protein
VLVCHLHNAKGGKDDEVKRYQLGSDEKVSSHGQVSFEEFGSE